MASSQPRSSSGSPIVDISQSTIATTWGRLTWAALILAVFIRPDIRRYSGKDLLLTAVLGASSFDCGVSGEPSKFGGALGVAVGSSNIGVIGPTAFYADTPVRLTANGGSFAGGAVRIAIHYLTCAAPD